jgi:hypothetical protein
MTRKETGIIMDILKTAYPRFYAGPEAPDPARALALWTELFSGDDVALVAAAVKALIATDEKGFPPTIGAVKAQLRRLTRRPQVTAGEAWTLVAGAVRNSLYGSREEFDRLPPEVRQVVGSPAQLREWAVMPSETVHSVVASNFQRAYQARLAAEDRAAALPPALREQLPASASEEGRPGLAVPGQKSVDSGERGT